MNSFNMPVSTLDVYWSAPSAEVQQVQEQWLLRNEIPLDYLKAILGDVSCIFSVGAPQAEVEVEVYRALSRGSRLKLNCPFPSEPDLA